MTRSARRLRNEAQVAKIRAEEVLIFDRQLEELGKLTHESIQQQRMLEDVQRHQMRAMEAFRRLGRM